MSDYIAPGAFLIAIFSAVLSFFSLQASRAQVRASLFAERMAVFKDVKAFMNPWFREGRPNLKELYLLVDAWERSHFLFDQSVTAFLRKLWKDAVRCDFNQRVINGELNENRQTAARIVSEINELYLVGDAEEPDVFIEAFKIMKMEQ
jgi:hypothetical protein